jgi:hypothetical protein
MKRTVFIIFAIAAALAVTEGAAAEDGAPTEARATVVVRAVTASGQPAPQGLPVRLIVMQMAEAHGLESAATDAMGAARFRPPLPAAGDPPLTCVTAVEYSDLLFRSSAFTLSRDEPQVTVTVTVYDVTHSRDSLQIQRHLIAFDYPHAGHVRVTEVLTVRNTGDRVIIADDDEPPIVADRPPANAARVVVLNSDRGNTFSAERRQVELRRAVSPGTSDLQYSYVVPVTRWPLEFRKPMVGRADETAVLLSTASLMVTGPVGPGQIDRPHFIRHEVTDPPPPGGTLEVTLHMARPPARLPPWSYFALTSIWVLAAGLIAFRRSDRQLSD